MFTPQQLEQVSFGSATFNGYDRRDVDAFLEPLIDDYIKPMAGQTAPDFAPLVKFLAGMAVIYILGIISSFLSNFLMVRVGQGMQKKIRDDMFTHMQTLPIRYFDTHPAGDVMSRYTADIDTLRQMITQALPNCISSIATMVTVFLPYRFSQPVICPISKLPLMR